MIERVCARIHVCVHVCVFLRTCVCGCAQIWASIRDLPRVLLLLLQAQIHNHKKDLSDNFCEPLERLLSAADPKKMHLLEVQREPARHLRRTCVCKREHTCSVCIMYGVAIYKVDVLESAFYVARGQTDRTTECGLIKAKEWKSGNPDSKSGNPDGVLEEKRRQTTRPASFRMRHCCMRVAMCLMMEANGVTPIPADNSA